MKQRIKGSFEKGRLLGLLCILMLPVAVIAQQEIIVPLGSNSWVIAKAGSERVTNTGWVNWQHADAVFSTWVYAQKKGHAHCSYPLLLLMHKHCLQKITKAIIFMIFPASINSEKN